MHLVEEEISRKKSTLPWNFPQFSLTIEYSTQIIEPHTNSHCRHNFPQQFTRTIYRTQEESNFIHTNFLSIFFLVCWFCGWYWNVTPTHKIPHLSHRTTIWNYFRGSISMMMLNNQRIEHIDAHTHRTRTKSIHSSTTLSLYMEQKTSISIQLGGKVIPFHWILVNVNHHRILSYLNGADAICDWNRWLEKSDTKKSYFGNNFDDDDGGGNDKKWFILLHLTQNRKNGETPKIPFRTSTTKQSN